MLRQARSKGPEFLRFPSAVSKECPAAIPLPRRVLWANKFQVNTTRRLGPVERVLGPPKVDGGAFIPSQDGAAGEEGEPYTVRPLSIPPRRAPVGGSVSRRGPTSRGVGGGRRSASTGTARRGRGVRARDVGGSEVRESPGRHLLGAPGPPTATSRLNLNKREFKGIFETLTLSGARRSLSLVTQGWACVLQSPPRGSGSRALKTHGPTTSALYFGRSKPEGFKKLHTHGI